MKVLLFAPPFEIASDGDGSSYPLALGYLGSVLEKNKIEVKAYDFLFGKFEETVGKVEGIIRLEKPEIVGISSMTTNRVSAFRIIKLIKELNPGIKIILGGVHPSIMHKQILDNFHVDFIVLGEGEETIVELVKAIKENWQISKIKKIKGIAFKYKGRIIMTGCRMFVKNLDLLPFPKHEYFEDKIRRQKTAYVITSRGCPIGCNFCSTTLHWGKIRRQRSVKNVIQEIKEVIEKYPSLEKIYFNDDEFIMNHAWIREFCSSLIKERISIKFECVGRVSSVSEELVKLMKKAGCAKINFGVESGSQRILNLIGKKINLEQVKKAYKICEKLGMPAGIYLMVGLPGETRESVNETIELLKNIRNADLYTPAIYQVYPGTPTYELAKNQGFITDDYWLDDKPAPFYTYEHSKRKLLFWSIKIALFSQYYKGNLFPFVLKGIKSVLNLNRLKKIAKKYLV